jgi:hypothetical protein
MEPTERVRNPQRLIYCEYVMVPLLNPLNAELNPICHLLALLGAHHILHVSKIRVNVCVCTTVPPWIGGGGFWNGIRHSSVLCSVFSEKIHGTFASVRGANPWYVAR